MEIVIPTMYPPDLQFFIRNYASKIRTFINILNILFLFLINLKVLKYLNRKTVLTILSERFLNSYLNILLKA